MSNLNQLVNKLTNALGQSSRSTPARRRTRRTRRRGASQRRPMPTAWTNSGVSFRNSIMPAAYMTRNQSRFSVRNMGNNTVRVTGADLVYQVPASLDTTPYSTSGIFTVIPANPAYWTGTRIGQLAGTYS